MHVTAIDGLFKVQKSDLQFWKKKGQFKDRFGVPVNMILEGENTDWIGLPRTWATPGVIPNYTPPDDIEDHRIHGQKIGCLVPPPARNAKQVALMVDVRAHLESGGLGGIIVAPTGFGKTYIGCRLIECVRRSTLVVTTKTDEMENWIRHCHDMLGVNAQRWHGDHVPNKNCEIAVGLVQSIAKGPDRYGWEPYEHFGLVIFDECHRLGAEFFSQACGHIPAEYRFGMTATPERIDGRDRVFKAHIGGVVHEAEGVPMVPKVYIVQSDFKLPVKVTRGKVKAVEPTAGRLSWVDRALRRNKKRNDQLIRVIHFAYKRDRYIVVFSNERKHLEFLHDSCNVPSEEKGFYVGGLKKEELEQTARKHVIFATVQMGGQGTNYPWWDCMILGVPMANIKQPIGRILREYPDKKTPVIFDILDDGVVWRNYAGVRMRTYKEYGAEVEIISV